MKNPHRFYGLKDLETDDIGFAWSCPKAEQSGCLGYELRRQMGARVIAGKYPNHLGVPLVELTKAWLAEFARPWPKLTTQQKRAWMARYNDKHLLPLGKHGKDPKPGWPGEVYSIKIDWDLSDREIRHRFDLALIELRPRDPWRQRTETAADQLIAIAAIRLIDCRGDSPTTKFVDDMSALLSRRGNPLFAKEIILMDAAKRFRTQESDFEVGLTRSGSLDIVLKAKEQAGMSK